MPARPISAGVVELFQRLGVDAYDRDEMRAFRDDIQWIKGARKREEAAEKQRIQDRSDRRGRYWVSGVSLLTTIAVAVGAWLMAHTTIGFL